MNSIKLQALTSCTNKNEVPTPENDHICMYKLSVDIEKAWIHLSKIIINKLSGDDII